MDNADLEKLKITPGRLVPKFHSSITEYKVTLASNIEEIKLVPLTSDGGASCAIKGDASDRTVKLKEGATSVVDVVVTAEDGQTNKTYTISITRLSASDACLSHLEPSSGSLQPSFSPSTLTYYCDLPSNLTTLSLKTKTEDPGMKVTLKDGQTVGPVSLSPGLTVIEVVVTSVNGSNTTTYTINAIRLSCPYPVTITSSSANTFTCTACAGTLHCPCYVRGKEDAAYCQKCLLELSRINKADPLTGDLLGEGWMVINHALDSQLSSQEATCSTPNGVIKGTISDIPALIAQQNIPDEVTEACVACSKKVPKDLLEVHNSLTCSSKLSETLPKTETIELPWQKRMVDISLPNDPDFIFKKAKELEQKYNSLLKSPNHYSSADILEPLTLAGSCYATMISIKPKEPQGHVGLGLVMEEFFYLEDFYGHKPIESNDTGESEAEISSKEEEFLAICQLHGVSEKASFALQLKAVEAEYLSLREAGQTHRSEQVQKLYQWKSKKALQASKGSYAVESESPLYKAKIKFEHAVSVCPTDHASCYHLGRLLLLLGDSVPAIACLKGAASIKPTHHETTLCLGLAMSSNGDSSNQVKSFLLDGLQEYLHIKELEAIGSLKPTDNYLHGATFWRSSNTLIGESFISLAHLGGHGFLSPSACLVLAGRLFSSTLRLQKGSTMEQLLWILVKGRAALLEKMMKDKSPQASRICRELSSLISHCQLPPSEQLRELQIKIFQDGVYLQPCHSGSLTHLGNGQLQQFEATGDKNWLALAEKSFRASLECEGKQINGRNPPSHISDQDWWIKRNSTPIAQPQANKQTPSSATPAKQPAQQPTRGKPTTTAAAGRGGKAMPSATPASKGPTTTTAAASRGGRQQPAGARGPPAAAIKGPPARGRGAAPVAGRGQPPAGRGKSVATLGELKGSSGNKPASASNEKVTDKQISPPQDPTPEVKQEEPAGPVNDVSYNPRLGLARTLAKRDGKPSDECIKLYREVLSMAPSVHDAYIELGELLAKSDPIAAVQVYSQFPFSNPPTFDDAYLHGEIVRLLMKSSSYDDPQLAASMIAMGRALGIGVLDKHVSVLEAKFKTALLKEVYAGVHGKPIDNPELQAFFKFKCWI